MPKDLYTIGDPGAQITLDPQTAQYDRVYTISGGRMESKDWRPFVPSFKYQSWVPKCTAMTARAIDYAVNKAFDKELPTVNADYLFIASGGQKYGNSIIAPLLFLKNDRVPFEDDVPGLDPNKYNYNEWDKYIADSLQASDEALKRGELARLAGVSSIAADNYDAMIDAMDYSPLSLAVPVLPGYFDALNGWGVSEKPSWHNVPVVKIHANKTVTVFDSLTIKADFDGFHDLPADYPRSNYCAVRDLPTGWKDTQNTVLNLQYPNAYNHYGLPRLALEVEQARALEFRKLIESPEQDPRIRTLAGRDWVVLLNAALYGGFSYYVIVNGRKYFSFRDKGSDLANCLYGKLRTGKYPLDLDRLRSQQ